MTEKILIKIEEKNQPMLLGRGMNRLALAVKPFRLKPTSFTSRIEGQKPKHIEAGQQMGWFKNILENPFKPWCFCISSDPNDRLAKLLAAYLMQNALIESEHRLPLWHDIMGGGFDNPVIKNEFSAPNLLVLSNVLPNSTALKFEKLRDILEHHSAIPRIVVTAGIDPYSFFQKLYYPLNGCVYIKSEIMKALEI